MKTIPPYQTAISLFCIDGSVRVFSSLGKAKKELGLRWIAENVGEHFRAYLHTAYFEGLMARSTAAKAGSVKGERVYQERRYVMRNDAGEPVTRADFQTPYSSQYSRYWAHRYAHWNGEGPVPGVHKHNAGRHYYRRPANIRARKLSLCLDPDDVAPRAKQSLKNLPDTWDDYGVASRKDKSWKRYRKTQYREAREEVLQEMVQA